MRQHLLCCVGDTLSRSTSDRSADLYVGVSESPLNRISAVTACGRLDGPVKGESTPNEMGLPCPLVVDSSLCRGSSALLLRCSRPLPQFLIYPPLRRRNSRV